jgi:hypothetical protein
MSGCRARVNYMKDDGEVDPVEVEIVNGRTVRTVGWQRCGFELMEHRSSVQDWDDEEQLQNIYHEEMAALATRLSGCSHAVISDHIVRNPERARLHQDYAPIQFAHSDFTETYGDRIKEFYRAAPPQAQAGLQRAGVSLQTVMSAARVMILQFWRNIGPRKMDLPLAFCDAESVPRADLRGFRVDGYAGGDFSFDTFGVAAPEISAAHRWFSFPELSRNEVVAFRTYDSQRAEQQQPFWTPHCAYRDPDVPDGGPQRCSIEVRATCLFD